MFKKIIFFLGKLIFLLAIIGGLGLIFSGFAYVLSPDKMISTYDQFLLKIVQVFSKFPLLNKITEIRIVSRIVIGFISCIYLFAYISKILSKLDSAPNYEIKTDDGTVSVSPSIVNNYVKEILKNDEEVKNLKVETIKHGKKFDIKMKADIATDESVADKSAAIQNSIRNDVSEKIGIEIGQVELVVAKLLKKSKPDVIPSGTTNNSSYYAPSKHTAEKEEVTAEVKEEKSESKKSIFGSLFGKKEKEIESDDADKTAKVDDGDNLSNNEENDNND
ncbi:alkaline shock response membrane anchor protein AmaP [Fusobacterium sp. PH5-44]|uniref:alkaline shock response membrane anchor protein AmaP n=1 Tax=unclassified Fusobacterium TaxID=2648384 RepID=UPI003D1ED0A3